MKYKYIIVIPARGGSKRLPRKNIMKLAGIPLITHSINYAKQEFPDIPIFVSSDDEEILEIAKNSDALPILRPDEISGDYSTTADVLKHATRFLLNNGYQFDYMILLQCTNPLRPSNLIHEAVDIIERGNLSSLVGVSPVVEKFGKIEDNRFRPWNYKFGQRSQDLEPLYKENGLIYISHIDLLKRGKIIDKDAYPFIVDHIYASVDIDTLEDFEKAEYILKNRHE